MQRVRLRIRVVDHMLLELRIRRAAEVFEPSNAVRVGRTHQEVGISGDRNGYLGVFGSERYVASACGGTPVAAVRAAAD